MQNYCAHRWERAHPSGVSCSPTADFQVRGTGERGVWIYTDAFVSD